MLESRSDDGGYVYHRLDCYSLYEALGLNEAYKAMLMKEKPELFEKPKDFDWFIKTYPKQP